MRALIVDDNPTAITALTFLLENFFPWVEVVATASNVAEGRISIMQHQPDLVFMDIEMPDGLGIDLTERFKQRDFEVIFVTAHEDYALRAIKQRAFDYLLKPIDLDDLQESLDAIRKRREGGNPPQVKGTVVPKRIAIPQKNGIEYLPVAELIRIEASGGYTRLHTQDKKCLTSSHNLKYWEDELDTKSFFRCHHAHLIHLPFVRHISSEGGYSVTLTDGSKVEIARRRYSEFQQAMQSME